MALARGTYGFANCLLMFALLQSLVLHNPSLHWLARYPANSARRQSKRMAYIIDQADLVTALLKKFTTSHAYQVAGQFANLEFWISEALHAIDAIAEYKNRFVRMSAAQEEWICKHNVISHCPMCKGPCEFGATPPSPPTKIPPKLLNDAVRRLKDAVYFFLVRCFRMNLIDEAALREVCARVGTSIEDRDLIRK